MENESKTIIIGKEDLFSNSFFRSNQEEDKDRE
jgi:hypothetical protein